MIDVLLSMQSRTCNLHNLSSKTPLFQENKGQSYLSLTIHYLAQLLFLFITCCSSAVSCCSWTDHILLPSPSPEFITPLCYLTSFSIFELLQYQQPHPLSDGTSPLSPSFLPAVLAQLLALLLWRNYKFCFTTSSSGYQGIGGGGGLLWPQDGERGGGFGAPFGLGRVRMGKSSP